jgi:hypothetical protein
MGLLQRKRVNDVSAARGDAGVGVAGSEEDRAAGSRRYCSTPFRRGLARVPESRTGARNTLTPVTIKPGMAPPMSLSKLRPTTAFG